MDWARDLAGISENDYRDVYRYEERHTTVVQMKTGDKEPSISSLKSEDDWLSWLESKEQPRIDGSASGFVLLLAKRMGEPSFCVPSQVGSGEWLDRYKEDIPIISQTQRTLTFASLVEKSPKDGRTPVNPFGSGRRGIRTLPFSEKVFRLVAKSFYTHGSISRVISRADVQTFSCSEVEMKGVDELNYTANVYSCRTSNAWDMDLALTTTYFPHCGLTFAILFGCPLSVEEEIIRRLSFATAEAAYPLLLPGIFIELERKRHVHVVEAMIDELETKIYELDLHANETEGSHALSAERRNQEKRTAYLDTVYLRNALVGWSAQLMKMAQHTEDLENSIFASSKTLQSTSARLNSQPVAENKDFELSTLSVNHHNRTESNDTKLPNNEEYLTSWTSVEQQRNPEQAKHHMRRAGQKIKERLQAIIDEYDDKIRDCTMRVDGMAMATQWAQGETNVEIALATGRDSRHMRSIALLTMVFLPGTFFASVFSMTFFNWSSSNGSPEVSGYIWIYVLVTVSFTLLTVGTWYYFVILRQLKPSKQKSEEEEGVLA